MEILPVHFLYPAELYVSKTPYQINTILGSCVAVCLFDPVTKIGGMNRLQLKLSIYSLHQFPNQNQT